MLEFRVDGMTCGGCARAVTNAVRSVDDAATVQVDLASKLVKVGTAADASEVQSAIEGVGYDAERLAA